MHNAAFTALGLDWVYLAFEVAEGEAPAALAAMRTLGIAGFSVTMPHKTAVAGAVDELTDAARRLDAVNCVVNRDGRLVGHNTDGAGFLDALAYESGFDVSGRRCAVLGAGGAARALVLALSQAGASEVIVVNRSAGAAERAAKLAGPVGRLGTVDDLAGCALVINATPLGMAGHGGPPLPAPPDSLAADAIAVDIVMNPRVTPWMSALRATGRTAFGGVGMLAFQAARAFTLMTGLPAPAEAMLAAVGVTVDDPLGK